MSEKRRYLVIVTYTDNDITHLFLATSYAASVARSKVLDYCYEKGWRDIKDIRSISFHCDDERLSFITAI